MQRIFNSLTSQNRRAFWWLKIWISLKRALKSHTIWVLLFRFQQREFIIQKRHNIFPLCSLLLANSKCITNWKLWTVTFFSTVLHQAFFFCLLIFDGLHKQFVKLKISFYSRLSTQMQFSSLLFSLCCFAWLKNKMNIRIFSMLFFLN